METTACLLCGATEARHRYTLPDALLGLPGSFTLVECVVCGLLYQNPRPAPNEISFYYPPDYDPFVPPPWANPSLLRGMLHLYGLKKRWRLVERHAPSRPGKRRLLDVGCATGVFLGAGSAAWQTVGVELSVDAARQARELFGLMVHQGTLEEVALEGQTFDVITMWDVLEHLHQPQASLQRVRELLPPDGIFVARVPNLSAWDARLCGRYWAGLDQPRHMFIPDERTLTQMLNQAGFQVRELICLGSTYQVMMLSWRFWLRQHLRNEILQPLAQRALENLLVRTALLPPLWVIDRKLHKGAVITVVAQPV
ncbi:bifunctional 2-polyprenyl-6-hydroxyphenol methylase/3-demethylubiquinol 3-O-methyltransferase UbiG [Candidatus Chloroploca sp. Khr17]|uniref:class I SAM-dependent methyltransferase n=1 Tax=Candidatus Chloroploca sp. Khr17 TaxID=2496869 RepID=UPI0013ECECDB|nr:class I SAM-dependent methyltransferase [Candidatus Chloroploca sp. Khr17]